MRTVCGGLVLDAVVQGREGRRAAERLAAEKLAVEKRAVEELAVEKLLRKLIRKPSRTPCVMVTDKPGSDGAARTGMGMNVEHRQHKGLNNRAKNAHLPTLRRERIMKWIIKRFTSARHLKRLVFILDGVANLCNCPRHAMSSSGDRALRSGAIIVWREIAEPGIAAQRQGIAPRGKLPVFAWPPFGKLTVPARSRYLRPSSKAG
jgi:putative transposase